MANGASITTNGKSDDIGNANAERTSAVSCAKAKGELGFFQNQSDEEENNEA